MTYDSQKAARKSRAFWLLATGSEVGGYQKLWLSPLLCGLRKTFPFRLCARRERDLSDKRDGSDMDKATAIGSFASLSSLKSFSSLGGTDNG